MGTHLPPSPSSYLCFSAPGPVSDGEDLPRRLLTTGYTVSLLRRVIRGTSRLFLSLAAIAPVLAVGLIEASRTPSSKFRRLLGIELLAEQRLLELALSKAADMDAGGGFFAVRLPPGFTFLEICFDSCR